MPIRSQKKLLRRLWPLRARYGLFWAWIRKIPHQKAHLAKILGSRCRNPQASKKIEYIRFLAPVRSKAPSHSHTTPHVFSGSAVCATVKEILVSKNWGSPATSQLGAWGLPLLDFSSLKGLFSATFFCGRTYFFQKKFRKNDHFSLLLSSEL